MFGKFDRNKIIKNILHSNDAYTPSSDGFSSSDESEIFEDTKYILTARQKIVVEWMVKRERENPPGGIIASDIGTVGDKLSVITGLFFKSRYPFSYNYASDGGTDSDDESIIVKGRTLILCSKSNISQWVQYTKKNMPLSGLDVFVYYGKHRDVSLEKLSQRDIVITTVALAQVNFRQNKNNFLYQIKWDRIVLDDPYCSTYNYNHKKSEALFRLSGICRWAFVGSNYCIDEARSKTSFCLIKFLDYQPLNNFKVWKQWIKENPDTSIMEKLKDIFYTAKII